MVSDRTEPDRPRKWLSTAIFVVVAAAVLLALGIGPRIAQQSALKAVAAAEIHPRVVQVTTSKSGPRSTVLGVPGMIEAIEQTAVNARATGYAQTVLANIGDRVKSGQVLAVVAAPDSDQQVIQAQAEVVQSEDAVAQARATLSAAEQAVVADQASLSHANAAKLQASDSLLQLRYELTQAERSRAEQVAALNMARANERAAFLTNDRYQVLASKGFAPLETADEDLAAYKSAEATTASAEAAVKVSDSAIQAAQAAVAAGVDNVSEAEEDIHSAEAVLAGGIASEESSRDAVAQAQDGVQANSANYKRLVVLKDYQTVRSPFAGVVTARNIDPGAYISEGAGSTSTSVGSASAGASATGASGSGNSAQGSASSSGSATAGGLFTIARFDQLRIYINVPQNDAALVTQGMHARVTIAALPGRFFDGVVSRTTVVLDPGSRTLVGEIDMTNPGNLLRPGMFSTVQLSIPQPAGVVLIPDSALVTGASGTQVITVDSSNALHYRSIQVGSDNGQEIEVLSGLSANETIVSAPSAGLTEGEVVSQEVARS